MNETRRETFFCFCAQSNSFCANKKKLNFKRLNSDRVKEGGLETSNKIFFINSVLQNSAIKSSYAFLIRIGNKLFMY